MQAIEALTRLITMADAHQLSDRQDMASNSSLMDAETIEQFNDDETAIAICQAMLNTAIPVARYRAFIEVETEQPKRTKFQESVAVKNEFTVCSVDMPGIISGLQGVTHVPTNCKITVWEQRQTGADMISGYQGSTKSSGYRLFIKGLPELQTMPTVQ